jgi:hypothetical protein
MVVKQLEGIEHSNHITQLSSPLMEHKSFSSGSARSFTSGLFKDEEPNTITIKPDMRDK